MPFITIYFSLKRQTKNLFHLLDEVIHHRHIYPMVRYHLLLTWRCNEMKALFKQYNFILLIIICYFYMYNFIILY